MSPPNPPGDVSQGHTSDASPADPVTLSGVVVRCRPEDRGSVRQALEDFPWADTHREDDAGHLIVTIEAQDVDQSAQRLLQIQSLPRVLSAELAAYVIDDGTR